MEEKGTLLEEIYNKKGKELLTHVHSLFEDTATIQAKILAEILSLARNTELGQKYDFNSIKNFQDYQYRVPLSEWETYEKSIPRLLRGEENIFFPGRTEYFIMTSGTTGRNKYIPESKLGALAKKTVTNIRRYPLLNYLGLKDLTKLGHVLALSSSGVCQMSEGGIPIGFASGITREQTENALKKLDAYPPEIASLEDINTVNYLIMRFALMWSDMVAIIGNNAGRLKALVDFALEHAEELIDDIEHGTVLSSLSLADDLREKLSGKLKPAPERAAELKKLLKAGRFIPRYYWPNLKLGSFWLTGTVGEYVKEIKHLLPEELVYCSAGYGASEAKITLPLKLGESSGVLSTFTAFYEFIPENSTEILLAHQLKLNQVYEIVLTTYSGLYRYRIGDLVRVTGFAGDAPLLDFVSKNKEVANISNEKVYGSVLNHVLHKTAEEMGYCLQMAQILPDLSSKRYRCFLEFAEADDLATAEYAALAEEKLQQTALGYQRRRKDGTLGAVEVCLMKKGWQEELYKNRLKPGVSISQIKLPVIINEEPKADWKEKRQ